MWNNAFCFDENKAEFSSHNNKQTKKKNQFGAKKTNKNKTAHHKKNQGFAMAQPEANSKSSWRSVGWAEDGCAQQMPS